MSANNYFGFTHGGTQYSSPAATYQTGQAAGYAVTHPQSYTAAARPAQATYEGYQSTHGTAAAAAATSYGFSTPATESAPPPPPPTTQSYDASYTFRATATAATYDGTKTYYQQQQQPAAVKSTYTAGAAYSTPTNRAPVAQKAATNNSYGYASGAVSTTYPTNYGGANSTTPATTAAAAANFSGYDAALYSAATMYVQQQQANSAIQKSTNNWNTFKRPGGMRMNRPKVPPKPQQLHYCDVCKISCAGPQTYREHLDGQKHKKKEAASKLSNVVVQSSRPGNSLRCELCDVTCTGGDAYAAHIRGAKHQKVVTLHTRLGKPIPSSEPTVLGATSSTATAAKSGAAAAKTTTAASAKPLAPGTVVVAAPTVKKALVTPKITFVGGTKLSTTGAANPSTEQDAETEVKTEDVAATEDTGLDMSKYDDKANIVPVGQDYIEEIKNDDGKVISFNCKLCECRFNDPNAKEMHMKGRRHRLQYKKKVQPDLEVDVKPSTRQRRIDEERMRRMQMKDEMWRRREEDRWREEMRMMEEEERLYWEERRRYEEEMEYFEWYHRYGRGDRSAPPPPPMARPFPGQSMSRMPLPPRRPDTLDDKHVLAKHTEIYPKDEGLQAVQKIVSNTEKALKQVSDFLAESQNPPVVEIKVEIIADDGEAEKKEDAEKKKEESPARILKGVMRVGVLAKGLLLKGDTDVQLVVLCSEKPTATLLQTVAANLPKQLTTITDDSYVIRIWKSEASIVVSTASEPKINVFVTLTSPVMRDGPPEAAGGENETVKDPPDVLDRQKCLDALAALRHAKWFQARASGLQSCVIIIRILRDLCQRVPTWTPLNSWAMELLVEKVVCSAGVPLGPAEALRRVMEALASGLLLPGGPGLMDPCEKDPTDAAAGLQEQEREDITASAQHALRLLSFKQIHKVLGMDPLPVPKFLKTRFPRKRRRDNSSGEGAETEGADGKKDKKDDGDITMESVTSEVAA